jgi:K+-transporting ATPase KdpF subunit
MNPFHLAILVVAAGLFVYLLCALLKSEWFS